MSEKLISIKEVADRTGLRPVTIRLWAASRKLSCVRLGRRVLFNERHIDRWISENTVPALPEREAR